MSNEIIKILDDLAKRFGVAIDWTAENIVPYLKELFSRLVTYGFIQSSILIAVGCLMIIGSAVMGKILYNDRKKCRERKEDTTFHSYYSNFNKPVELEDGFGYAMLVGSVVVGIAGIIVLGCNVGDLIRWAIIPEIQIIQWIDNLIATM